MQPTDPLYSQQWHFTRLGNIERIWDEFSGAGVHVGVYDTGIEITHPGLAGAYDPTRRVIINGTPLDGLPNELAPNPHGTAVVGLIDAAANDGLGWTRRRLGSDLHQRRHARSRQSGTPLSGAPRRCLRRFPPDGEFRHHQP